MPGDRKTLAWKDTTSYTKEEEERIPRTWELRTTGCRIIVTRSRHHEDKWVLFVYGAMRLEDTVLRAEKVEKAQREALEIVSTIAKNIVDGLPRFEKVGDG